MTWPPVRVRWPSIERRAMSGSYLGSPPSPALARPRWLRRSALRPALAASWAAGSFALRLATGSPPPVAGWSTARRGGQGRRGRAVGAGVRGGAGRGGRPLGPRGVAGGVAGGLAGGLALRAPGRADRRAHPHVRGAHRAARAR